MNYEICVPELSTNVVSSAVKAKFRFPAHDPKPNSVTDNRTEAQIVGDIIRIWSQVLRPDERTLWSEIAKRDLTKTSPLESVCNCLSLLSKKT